MPEEPVTFDELEQLMLRLTGNSVEALEQQLLSRLKEHTFVGGKRVARQELPGLPKDAVTTVHRVKVSLYGAKPPVWRRLEIPSAMPLNLVHAALQIAFDWHGYHLHVFETVCGEFGSPGQYDDWAERQDEATAALAQVARAERTKVVYSYDFGDEWRHDIVVEKIVPAEPGVAYPRCTGGRRDAPPEGCGGIWVFNEQFADLGDLFNVGTLNERMADLATVLIPARPDPHSFSAPATRPLGEPGGAAGPMIETFVLMELARAGVANLRAVTPPPGPRLRRSGGGRTRAAIQRT